MDELPDLVKDTRLPTDPFPSDTADPVETIHRFRETDRKSRTRVVARVEHWQRQEKVEEGGYGVIWLETCTQGGRDDVKVRVVKQIKLLEDLSYHAGELEALAKFTQRQYVHCFVELLGWFLRPGYLCIAMEYLEMGDLDAYLKTNPPIPEDETKEVARQILEGLEFMHGNGFAHRDMKPDNILIKTRPPDDEWWVKIADFGISMRYQKTAGAEVMGTPGYIAPELLNLCENGSLFAADMWAFGETIFRILTKRVAFSGETLPRYAKGEISFPVEKLHAVQVSQPGVDFIVSLMCPLPTDRVSVYMATKNPWIDPTPTGPQNSNTGLETLGDGDPPVEPTDKSDQRTPNGKYAHRASADLDLPGSESQDLNGGTPSSASAQLNIGKQLCRESQDIKNFERVSALTDVRTSAQPTGETHSLYVSVNTISSSASRGSYPRLTTGDKHKLSTSPMAPLRSPPLSAPGDPVTEPLTKPLNVDLQEQNPLPFFAYELQSVAFSPDGKFLASGSAGVVRIRDISTGAEIMSLTGHNGDVRALAFSPDGSRLATGCSDGTIRLWRTSKWEYIRTLSGHTGLIKTLLFSPENSSTLASASADGTVRVWHLSKMQAYIVRTDTAEHDYIALSFTCSGSAGYGDGSPGTYLLAACWRRIYHVTVDTGYSTSWETLADRLSGLCISPDQQLVAGVSHDDPGAISIMDIRPRNFQSRGETFFTLKCSAKLFQYEMQFSPNGRLLVARAQGPVTIVDEFPRHCLFVWDVATGQEVLRREFFAFSVPIFAFSPDGSLIAAPALSRGEFSAFPASNVVRIWKVAQVDASE